jgi:hypothetical protein
MGKPFIHYQIKKGLTYASIYIPRWEKGKKKNDIENLGRVLDKEAGIFRSRKRGVFHYDLQTGFSYETPAGVSIPVSKNSPAEKRILNFGDVYISHKLLEKEGFAEIFRQAGGDDSDSLMALILFRMLCHDADSHAFDWRNGTYARLLFPKARLESQRISDLLAKLGDESLQQDFFKAYLGKLYGTGSSCGILIDSTGLPNDIKFNLTEINCHNGVISNEARLIYVVDRQTKMPIYFRYVPGNVVDVSTLKATLEELDAYKVNVDYSILDAGYYSEGNIKALYEHGISFVTRLVTNRVVYKDLIANHIENIVNMNNYVMFNGRLIYMVRKEISLFGNKAFAFVAVDYKRRTDETIKLAQMADEKNKTKMTKDELETERKMLGSFVIISSQEIDINDILPIYYNRQSIEQIFDICKNNINLLPLRTHSVETFSGHILVSFMAVISYLALNKLFIKQKYSLIDALCIFRYLHCKVFDDVITIGELNKKMKEILSILDITITSPMSID